LLPVLLDKRFGADGRHQLSLLGSTAIASKFVEATGVHAAYTFNFNDLFGLEIGAGGFLGRESSIMEQVRLNFANGTGEPPLSDLNQLQWIATVSGVFVPIYGKMSFASEIDPSFDFFFLAGAGAVGVKRKSVVGDFSTVTVAFNAGLGMRFYITRLIAIRLEFRDYFFPDPDPAPEVETKILMDTPDYKPDRGLSFNLHLQAGIQFAFGGDE
jgi:outer membrane beta-barrel protein